MSVEVVQKNMGYLLEGPHWDDVTNTLLYIDIYGKLVHSFNPVTKEAKKVMVHDQVGAVVTTSSGRTLVSVGREIGLVDWETGTFERLLEIDMKEGTRFNDCKCDPAGRFWAGTMAIQDPTKSSAETEKGQGSLFCLHHDKKLNECVQNVDISNGLAWSSDRKTMYYIDSLTYGVDAFDYNIKTGEIANRRQVIKVSQSDGIPDGMCIDTEDMLWVAMFDGWSVNRYNPKTGEKLRSIKFPTKNITSCCWGGANRDELYVTCAKHFLNADELEVQDTAGSLFRVTDLGVTGVKCDVFKDI
ncbi:regucalcin [Strongylocentrotus purpuratus]|uniref:Regucalcin n=1 Tax=Strongylocentrotus purpuratus TaxID=7668 RepID=A0A7M7G039_STRPU|nr:regucalcin [Strongylocentrotus purpuratus]